MSFVHRDARGRACLPPDGYIGSICPRCKSRNVDRNYDEAQVRAHVRNSYHVPGSHKR